MLARGLVGAIVGALTGAVAGGFSYALDTSLAVGHDFLGPTRDWWRVAAILGAGGGAAVGLVFGLTVVFSRASQRTSLSVGCLLGIFGVIFLLAQSSGDDWQLRSTTPRVLPLLVCVVSWSLLGSLLSLIANKLPR